jgi:subtilisin family serine protease
MNRWRPLTWLLLSLACFIAAVYFWRLGDKWQAQKTAHTPAPAAAATPSAASNQPVTSGGNAEIVSIKSSSTAPVVELNPPATNAVVPRPTNAFPYRLSNTKQTVGELSHTHHAILLENALIDTSKPLDLQIPDSLRSHGDPGSYIVQANGLINDAFRAQLKAAGASMVAYIPPNSYLVRASAASAQQLAQNNTVIPYEPYYKIKQPLMRHALAGKSVAGVNVAVFPDALVETKAALEKMGVTIASESRSPFGPQLALRNINNVAAIAGLPGIEEVEPSSERILVNDLTRVLVGVASDAAAPTNYLSLTGSNVLVAVADSWVFTNGATIFNPDLTNIIAPANLSAPFGFADTEGHATHVGGIIAASGLNSPAQAVGSDPGADMRGKAPSATLWALPLSLTDSELQESAANTNALISNNSWGYGTSLYNLASASYDQAVRDSLPGATGSQPIVYVFAAGNSGDGGDDGSGGRPDSLLSPATAKNVISVGAGELPRDITNDVHRCDVCLSGNCTTNKSWEGMTDSSDQIARFSSRGNVGIGVEGDFGRFKPDVVAPGTFVVSTRSMTWDTNAYDNPINTHVVVHPNEFVNTTNLSVPRSILVPCDAIQLSIAADAFNPVVDLPIYVKPNVFPTLADTPVNTNFASLPPDAPFTPTDTTWFYAVSNPTNVTVHYQATSFLTTTNDLGDYFDILQTNLNNNLVSSNGQLLYRYESGTSMAAPAVAGVLALMEDFFTNRWHYQPSPALMKALLINGARSLSSTYDFQVRGEINYQGWGLVNLANSLPDGITNSFSTQGASMLFVDQNPTNALATGDSQTIFVSVDPSAQDDLLRVTLVWTDPPGNPAASIKLVNDLDLVVTNLDSLTDEPLIYFGNDILANNTFNLPWDTNSTLTPVVDNVNNVENIYIKPPLATNYSITVYGRAVNVNAVTAHPDGVVQDYALVVSSGSGITNALKLTNSLVVSSSTRNITTITNQFPDSPDSAGGLLLNQHTGASSPLQGTNTLGLGSINHDQWGNNGQITIGVTNQWHFYVITNRIGTECHSTIYERGVCHIPAPGPLHSPGRCQRNQLYFGFRHPSGSRY